MKKVISLTLILILVVSASLLPVGAQGASDFDRAQAEKLFKDSYDLFNIYQDGCSFGSDIVNGVYEGPWIICDYNDRLDFTIKETSGAEWPITGERILKIKLRDKEYDVKSKVDVIAVAENYYLPKLAKYLTVSCQEPDRGSELIQEADNGKVYFCRRGWQVWPPYHIKDYGKFRKNGDNATLEVYANRELMAMKFYHCKAEIEFTNTENGWRISGGSMFDLLTETADYKDLAYKYSYYNYEDNYWTEIVLNPNTGDTSYYSTHLLTVLSIAMIAIPTSLIRKSRRHS